MNEIIQLDDDTRIRKLDEFNWVVELRHGGEKKRWRQANGDGHGPFLRAPSHAASWLLDWKFGNSGFEGDLKQAVAEFQRIADELADKFEKALA